MNKRTAGIILAIAGALLIGSYFLSRNFVTFTSGICLCFAGICFMKSRK